MNRTSASTRSAGSADLPAIRALLVDCGLPPEGIEACIGHCRVVELDGRLVGCGAIEPCLGAVLLRSLAVSPTCRGRGIAARLVETLEGDARDIGAAELWLLTATAADWFAARDYRPCARVEAPEGVRTHAQFQTLCPASARLMRRLL